MIAQDIEVRDGFIEALESRFLFLAADARSTLRYPCWVLSLALANHSFLFWASLRCKLEVVEFSIK